MKSRKAIGRAVLAWWIVFGLATAHVARAQSSGLTREIYTGISGNDVSALLSAPSFPDNPATRQTLTAFFETGPDEADNYGQRIRGYLTPPETGSYVFWIASDDQSVLHLSSDDSPERRRVIATVSGATGFRDYFAQPNQQSAPIFLEGGRLYYIEALMKEGGGSDHFSTRWLRPGGTIEAPIPASYFLPAGTALFPPEITRQPASFTVVEGEEAVFRVEVRNLDPVTYQWQRDDVAIPGATGPVYRIARVRQSDNGARFRVTLANALGAVVSEVAVLTVAPDQTPPVVESAFNSSLTSVVVRFSEPVSPDTALSPARYTLEGGSVLGAERGRDDTEVILETSELTPGALYRLEVSGVTDQAAVPNATEPGASVEFVALTLTPSAIGGESAEGTVEAAPGGLNVTATSAGGLGGNTDQLHFSRETRTGDFDVSARIESMTLSDLFAQAGLMARANLRTNSPYVATLATPAHAGVSFSWRGMTGQVARATGSFPVNYPHLWVRLKRSGTNFTGYASADGQAWTRLGSAGVALPETVLLGLVVSSRSSNAPVTVAFRDYVDVTDPGPTRASPPAIEPLGPSSRNTGLVISEIMYHPLDRDDGRRLEFVEIANADSVFVDISGYRLEGSIRFVFPPGTLLPAGGRLVVAQSPEDMAAAAGFAGALGPWEGSLPRDTGVVQLTHRLGALLLEVEYQESSPWPASADGGGHSLALTRPSYGEADPRAWSASARRGGSPGAAEAYGPDPYRGVVINEILARSSGGAFDFVELYNHTPDEVDLSGCVLTDNARVAKFRIPDGVRVASGGFVSWDETELGFALNAEGEAVYLISPDEDRVIDAIRFGPQLAGVSSGRSPDGADEWRLLAGPTPGAANTPKRPSDVIISEIMYHPPGMAADADGGSFVELLNRSDRPVNLRDWRFVDGITFTFSSNLELQPGERVVVAADAARLRAAHPELPPTRVVGNFEGNLRDSGERLALAQPLDVPIDDGAGGTVTNRLFVVVDEVSYKDGGRWGAWTDGDGSSLELIDPRADNERASNWAGSDESAKGEWTRIEFTGSLELGQGQPDELHIMLLGGGECLVDNVEVIDQGGGNRVPNSTFEAGFNGWIAQGNHVYSSLGTNGMNSRRSLHLRASGGGDNGANRVKIDLTGPTLPVNSLVTIRADAKWIAGDPQLLLRLKGNHLETLGLLPVPANLGTPGAPNSREVANAGPAIWEVQHQPVLPAAMETVYVTARVQDPDGVSAVRLKYRFDPSVSVMEKAMRDDGTDGDLVANDGIYTASIPGQATGVLVAFWIEALDNAAPPARATFPEAPENGECLVRFGDEIPASSFGTYRFWMTQENIDTWSNREVMSNQALDGTLVYGTSRAIYNAGARYRGSAFIRPNYDTPTGSLSAYVWTTPADDELLGADEFNLDWLEQPGRDPTLQRERLSFWVGEQLGVPFSHVRYIQVYVNGVRRGEVYTDSQQPNGDYIESWFPGNDSGEIYKIDDWFEFNDAVAREFNVDAQLVAFPDSEGQLRKTRYRWNWERKSNRGLDDDYSSLLNLVEAVNIPDPDLYKERVEALIDPDGWLRPIVTRRVVGDWDGYGYDRGKNTFAYLPEGGRWHLLLWDLDFSLGGGSDSETTGIFTAQDPVMVRMYQHPYFRRVYLQGILDAVRGPLAAGAADPLMDANYAAFLANGVQAASPAPIKSWIAGRRNYLSSVLNANNSPWTIAVNGPITTDESVVTIEGTAPLAVRTIKVNGVPYVPEWPTLGGWRLQIPLRSGSNRLALSGVDAHGATVAGAQGEVVVEYTGAEESPDDFVRISEIMYEPPHPDAEFVELHNRSARSTFDLSNWRLEGVDFDFPGGVSIRPGEHLVVVKDRAVFQAQYGLEPRVIGVYPGRLDNAGEPLRLLRPGGVSQPYTVVNELRYESRAPWPTRAEGDGGSLQLLDTAQDNRRPANWYAVDAAGHGYSEWRFVSVTDRAASPVLRLSLSAPGEVHIDDVSVVAGTIPRQGQELVTNGGFEGGLGPAWTADPGVAASTVDSGTSRSGNSSLRLVASADGFSPAASLRQTLSTPIAAGEHYTLSFWYLPGATGPDLTVGLEGSGIMATVDARETPVAPATPGRPSSVQMAIPPIPDIWINEVYPGGPGGASGGWIELFNAGPTAVNLSGWFLSPNPLQPGAWAFPPGATIPPGDFLVVGAAGAGGAVAGADLQANFVLSAGSGTVVLSRARNGAPVAVDWLDYEFLIPGRSSGSYPDGAWTQRVQFETPTPGAFNDITSAPVAVFINEWMSRNNSTLADPADGDFDDWFELYNAGSAPVDLAGYSLTDDLDEPRKSVIPEGFVLQPGAVMLVWADGEPEQNAPGRELHVDFALSADGEAIALFSPGGAIVDFVEFGPLDRDVSEGLMPDGAPGTATRLPRPTPRARNGGGVETLRIAGIAVGAGQVAFGWTSEIGGRYQPQFCDALDGSWINLGPPVVAAGATTTVVDASGPTGPGRFYRVLRLAP